MAGVSARYLPPYSPNLNPIEQVFAKTKALLRRAEPEPRLLFRIRSGRRSMLSAPTVAKDTSPTQVMGSTNPETLLAAWGQPL